MKKQISYEMIIALKRGEKFILIFDDDHRDMVPWAVFRWAQDSRLPLRVEDAATIIHRAFAKPK